MKKDLKRRLYALALTGLIMSGAEPIWVIPDKLEDWAIWGPIMPETIEKERKSP